RTRAPVARVRITAEDGTRTRTGRTGPDGRYRIRGLLPQRPYRLRADEPRYTPYVRDRVLLTTAETLRLDLPLTLAATLTGRVRDGSGRPVADAEIELGSGRGFGARAARALGVGALATARPKASSGNDGKFEVKGLSEGDYSLTVSKPGFADHRLDRVP